MQSESLQKQFAVLDRDLIENTVRSVLAMRTAGKFDAAAKYFAPDVVYECIGNPAVFPYAGCYTGLQAVIDVHRRINVEMKMTDSVVYELIIEGNQAFSRQRMKVKHRGTGVREIYEVWDIWYFAGGLITESKKFVDISAWERLQGQ